MTKDSPTENKPQSKILFIVLAIVFSLILLSMVGFAGYMIGRNSAISEVVDMSAAEPLTDLQEVTREVTREVNVVVTPTVEVIVPTIELVTPLENPDVVETVVPSDFMTPSSVTTEESSELDFTTFEEVWSFIEEEFDGELPEEKKRLYAAITGSLETLDDEYTRFIRPDVAERMREDMSGSVSGIGAFVRENDNGYIEITRPIDGQPADLAGLLPGDVIISVDGETVEDRDFNEVLMMIRGPEGTTVTLTIMREDENEPLDFTIVRALFEVAVVEKEMLGSEEFPIAYIHLTSFTRNADTAVFDALKASLEQNPQALIFDLRDNGGGFLDQAVDVADIFLSEGVVLYERSSGGIDKKFDSDTGDLGEKLPLVVLVNAGSASASEIVAGAIQDHGRGTLIGEPTFGKGSVQLVHTLSDGSELRVTIARWYTPNNKSISDEGITPDIEIPSPLDLGGEDDTQLQRAIKYLLEGE
jgi:carboxyl-terminal processing protease